MADSQLLNEAGTWLTETLVSSLTNSIEAMTSQQPTVEWRAIEPGSSEAAPGKDWMWWEQPVSLGGGAVFWVGAPSDAWRSIGQVALAAAGIDDATDEDCRGTWNEIQVQTLSATTHAIGRRLRKDVSCEGGKELPGPPVFGVCVVVTVTLSDAKHAFRFGWNSALQQAVDGAAPVPTAEPPVSSAPEPAGKDAVKGPERPDSGTRTLDLLLEVELPVSVSFGRAQLALKDVLKLNSGSIVELNRSISEPVEVIVNNCVVARGEVVVVEGNYGVRIKQIVSREERLRTLY